jgi:hypothetical protein
MTKITIDGKNYPVKVALPSGIVIADAGGGDGDRAQGRNRKERRLRQDFRRQRAGLMVKREPQDLHTIIPQLGQDERRVLAHIAERLLIGQRQYGLLDIANDQRDWTKEASEEAFDQAVYVAIRALAKSPR